jgi:hypothetical protein
MITTLNLLRETRRFSSFIQMKAVVGFVQSFAKTVTLLISWTLELRPGVRAIAGGSYDDPDWFNIEAHIWTSSGRSESSYPDSVKVYEKGLPPA